MNRPEIGLVGLSHKTAPVDIRERFTLGDEALPGFFEKTCAEGVDEIVYLSTCNRVEIYFVTRDMNMAVESVLGVLEDVSLLHRETFESSLYKKYSREAVLHLLSVASSLDSMVLGENEIFFQVKNCYGKSVRAGRAGAVLNRLFHQAFRTAKRVRTETDISKNPISIAYIATELARKIFDDLSCQRALLLGAGEMGELILKYFTKFNIGEITIANRSLANAERIAKEVNREARIVPIEDLASAAQGVDIVIASASSPQFLVTTEMMRSIAKKRGSSPIFLIDIAVPRNVDPEVGKLNNVFLYNIDDLKSISDENLKHRLGDLDTAKGFIRLDADEFYEWYEGLAVVPAIVKMRNEFEAIRSGELERYRRRGLKHLSDDDFRMVEDLTRQIMTKTLHNPIAYLKRYQTQAKGHHDREARHGPGEAARIIEDLFKK
ncbi:MAG TPA: glutamyl-tRNA reductase [Spirochaetota bacterium]|nr:glutamyl-tRNA reductase [Spirochaetota bacterium]